MERRYDIVMRTMIGKRKGQIFFGDDLGFIEGSLQILNHVNPFTGEIKEDGRCILHGNIVSIMKAVAFEAIGYIEDQSLHLKVAVENEVYEVTGIRIGEL